MYLQRREKRGAKETFRTERNSGFSHRSRTKTIRENRDAKLIWCFESNMLGRDVERLLPVLPCLLSLNAAHLVDMKWIQSRNNGDARHWGSFAELTRHSNVHQFTHSFSLSLIRSLIVLSTDLNKAIYELETKWIRASQWVFNKTRRLSDLYNSA